MGWQCGWQPGEGNVAFALPLVDVVHGSGSAGRALGTFGRWGRRSDAADVRPAGVNRDEREVMGKMR